MLAALGGLSATSTFAADNGSSSNAKAVYQQDRALCNSGQSNQDRATCLKEAGAAYDEARKGRINDDQSQYKHNALMRCDRLSHEDRRACRRRIKGDGISEGSVEEGGIYRKIVTPIPPQ
ncbi:MAG: hypothetical protein VB032_01600 [Burkholderiaceae bacterium]|nr:hypothetical protein [Burkholderiaceae bacterium]